MTTESKFNVGDKVRIRYNAPVQDAGAARKRDGEVVLTIMDILSEKDAEYPIKAGVGHWDYWFTKHELFAVLVPADENENAPMGGGSDPAPVPPGIRDDYSVEARYHVAHRFEWNSTDWLGVHMIVDRRQNWWEWGGREFGEDTDPYHEAKYPPVTPPAPFAVGEKVRFTDKALSQLAHIRRERFGGVLTVIAVDFTDRFPYVVKAEGDMESLLLTDVGNADELELAAPDASADATDVIPPYTRTEADIEREKGDTACMSWWAECERLEAEVASKQRTIETTLTLVNEQTDRAVAAENALDALEAKYDIDMGVASHADAILTQYVNELVGETNELKRDLEAANAKVAALRTGSKALTDALIRIQELALFTPLNEPIGQDVLEALKMGMDKWSEATFWVIHDLPYFPPDPTPPANAGGVADDDEPYPTLPDETFSGVGIRAGDVSNYHGGFAYKPALIQGHEADYASMGDALVALYRDGAIDDNAIQVYAYFIAPAWTQLIARGYVTVTDAVPTLTNAGKERATALDAPFTAVHDLKAAASDDGRDNGENVRNSNRLAS